MSAVPTHASTATSTSLLPRPPSSTWNAGLASPAWRGTASTNSFTNTTGTALLLNHSMNTPTATPLGNQITGSERMPMILNAQSVQKHLPLSEEWTRISLITSHGESGSSIVAQRRIVMRGSHRQVGWCSIMRVGGVSRIIWRCCWTFWRIEVWYQHPADALTFLLGQHNGGAEFVWTTETLKGSLHQLYYTVDLWTIDKFLYLFPLFLIFSFPLSFPAFLPPPPQKIVPISFSHLSNFSFTPRIHISFVYGSMIDDLLTLFLGSN